MFLGNRAANASIKGFEYQLLQSLSMILKSYVKDRTNVIEIEGIEDLDIHGSDSVDLYQFKYYEKSNPRNSVFQEAIAYLFCHWKKHKSESYVYKLLVYSTGELSSMNIEELMKVLSLKKSSAIREKELTKSALDIKELNEFLSVFKFEKVCSYEDSLKEIHIQIENIFNVPDDAVSLFYLPLMLKEVHDKAIEESSKNRTVNTDKFIRNIKSKARDMNRIILWNYEDTGKTIQTLHSFLNNEYSLKTQRYSYVLQFGVNGDVKM